MSTNEIIIGTLMSIDHKLMLEILIGVSVYSYMLIFPFGLKLINDVAEYISFGL